MPDSTSSRIILISGTDAARIGESAARRVSELTQGSDDAFGLDVVRQGETSDIPSTLRELISTLRSPAFLAEGKVVWLRDFGGFDKEGAKTAKTTEAVAFRELCDTLEKRLPPSTTVVLSGPGIDRRKRLYNLCDQQGEVILLNKPDVTDRNWESEMSAAVRQAAAERNVRLPAEVVAFFVKALGARTDRIATEMDKLIAYCGGPDQPITEQDAWEICTVEGEQTPWALLDALGERNLPKAFNAVDFFLEREKNPDSSCLRYVLQIGRSTLDWLRIRLFMAVHRLRDPRAMQGFLEKAGPDAKQQAQAEGYDFVGKHPYRVRMMAQQAQRYSGQELVEAVIRCRDANVQCVYSGTNPRLVLETLIRDIVTPDKHR